ncbi:MAG: hypothetical protein ACP5TY_09195, partial [Thermodesulforhabdaceae bacterium]
LLPFVPLMRGGEEAFDEAERRIYESSLTRIEKADLLTAMALLSGIISKELPVKLIEKRRHIMIESFGYELIKKEGYEEGLQKGFQQGMQQGIQQGLQQGIEQGIEKGLQKGVKKGLLEGSREMVLEVLTEKFGSVPQDVERRIRSINSRRRLKDLLRQAVRASTIEEFARLLS